MKNNNQIITEELKTIVALMSYDRSKTLSEQDTGFTRMLDRQFSTPEGAQQYLDDNAKFVKGVIDAWDSDTAGWVELGLTIGGFILIATGVGAPIGGAMIAAGTSVGVADAGVRFYRGDTFGGTLMLVLQLIPGGELVNIIKGGKSLIKVAKYSDEAVELFNGLTKEGMEKLNQKAAKGTLSKAEAEAMEMVMESAAKQAPKITMETLKATWTKLQLSLYEATLENTLAKTLPILVKLGKFTAKTTIMIGSTAIGVDLLWKLVTLPDGPSRKIRNESEFGVLLDMLYGGTFDKSPQWVKDAYLNVWKSLYNEDGTPNYSKQGEMGKLIAGNISMDDLANNPDVQEIDGTESMKRFENEGLQILNSGVTISADDEKEFDKGIKNVQPVTFQNLMNGLQTIRKGQKGSVVRDIQRMLVTLGYDLGTSGKLGDGVDGDFGDATQNALYYFQLDNDLEGIDSIVGEETANKLYELYLEKKNGNEE